MGNHHTDYHMTYESMPIFKREIDHVRMLGDVAQIRFNTNKDGYLSIDELKRMMEVLGAPQTHLGLKAMIKEVDEDGDNRLSFHEFMLVFRKARAGELDENSGLGQLAKLTEIDVDKVGVNGAKDFFEAKIVELQKGSKFENEIREEQEERKRQEEEKSLRRQDFLQKAAIFKVN
ncbi:hypothetical protein JTB14_032513 [Gonioctena quinquepunctata]|nr:hypothetical protein JTB14_032513 [Gonioctena quinquepunctata]